MSATMRMGSPQLGTTEVEALRGTGLCLVVMGIALIILGFAAIGSAFIATFTTVLVFGILLIMGAVAQVITAIMGRQWRGFFLHLLTGVLYFVAGMFLIDSHVAAALGLTLMIAAYLMVGGILRIVLALVERFHSCGWVLLNGVVSLVLGVSIWRQWPLSGLWVIGLFVGIEMLFSGLAWLMLGLGVRSIPRTTQPM
jgi:uncharacterized membrane protein HdeD (DUF308 family)